MSCLLVEKLDTPFTQHTHPSGIHNVLLHQALTETHETQEAPAEASAEAQTIHSKSAQRLVLGQTCGRHCRNNQVSVLWCSRHQNE